MTLTFTPHYYDVTVFTVERWEMDAADYKEWSFRARLRSAGLSKHQVRRYMQRIRSERILKATGISDAIDTLNDILNRALTA